MIRRLFALILLVGLAFPVVAKTTNVKALNAATSTGTSSWVATQDDGTSNSPGTVGAVQVTLYASGSTTSSVTYQTSPDQSHATVAYTFTNIGATPVTIQCSPSPYGRLNYASGTGTISGFIVTMAAPSETGGCHTVDLPGTISLSGATGTGSLVLATTPTLVTPVLGVATATSLNGLTVTTTTGTFTLAAAKVVTINNTLTLAGTDSTTMTFPTTSATVARTDAANSFTGTQTVDNLTDSGLTITRVPYASTAGLLIDSSAFTFATATGSLAATIHKGVTQTTVLAGTADGAVAVLAGTVFATKAGVLAATVVQPTTTTHDGAILRFIATTANANTVTMASHGIQGNKNIATMGGAVGDSCNFMAYQAVWYLLPSVNCTLSGS